MLTAKEEMRIIKIKKGLDLPIKGSPDSSKIERILPTRAGLIGFDYVGLKPTMLVKVGDQVKLGQPLFTDKKLPGVKYTSPASGKIIEINRGGKKNFSICGN